MDFLGMFIDTAIALKAIADAVHANRKQCERLAHRVNSTVPALRDLNREQLLQPSTQQALQRMIQVVEKCKAFMSAYTSQSWFERVFKFGTNGVEFEDLTVDFNEAVQSLQLAVSAQSLTDAGQRSEAQTNQLRAILESYRAKRAAEDQADLAADHSHIQAIKDDIIRAVNESSKQNNQFVQERFASMRFWMEKNLKQSVKDAQTGSSSSVSRDDETRDANQRDPLEDITIPFCSLSFQEKIGSGGFGDVWLGNWQVEKVAIKVLHARGFSEDTVKELKQEALLLAQLRHRNIICLYGVCLEPSCYCMVMEYAPHNSLFSVLQNKAVDIAWETRWSWMQGIALGMSYLYRRTPPVEHRDLKSLNVLIDGAYQARISDFGLARARRETAVMTGKQVGSLHWMAPELMKGFSAKFTEKCDVYAAGVIFYEIASRAAPYADCTDDMIIRANVLAGERLPIPESVPRAFADLISTCWHQNPDVRPTFAGLVQTIDAAVPKTMPLSPSPLRGSPADSGSSAISSSVGGTGSVGKSAAHKRIQDEETRDFWMSYWDENQIKTEWDDFIDCLQTKYAAAVPGIATSAFREQLALAVDKHKTGFVTMNELNSFIGSGQTLSKRLAAAAKSFNASGAPAPMSPPPTSVPSPSPMSPAPPASPGLDSPFLVTAGMRLEARDRLNPHIICAATIAEVLNASSPQTCRVTIHFDGWSDRFNFRCHLGNDDLFPIGHCAANGISLQPPRGHMGLFSWSAYLQSQSARAVPESWLQKAKAFVRGTADSAGTVVSFQGPFFGAMQGMKLEAVDKKNPSLICVASIKSVRASPEPQLLVSFDGWTDLYDYWCRIDDPALHRVGHCASAGVALQPPKGHVGAFSWPVYLDQQHARAVPDVFFAKRNAPPSGGLATPPYNAPSPAAPAVQHDPFFGLAVGMRLEAIDAQNPSLTCVATVKSVRTSPKPQILVTFDGWTDKYDYWCDTTSPSIFPVGYCDAHGKRLSPPKDHQGVFNWNQYLASRNAAAVPASFFSKRFSA